MTPVYFLGLRDPLGLRVAVVATVAWIGAGLILVWSSRLLVDLLALLFVTLVTVGCSTVLCRARADLSFATPLACLMMFPPDPGRERLVFRFNCALTLIVMLPPLAILLLPRPVDPAPDRDWVVFAAFILGSFAFSGLLHHAARRRILGPARPTTDPPA